MKPFIIKSSGEKERFSERKLKTSLLRAGTTPRIAKDTSSFVSGGVFEGMSSDDIYRRALRYMISHDAPAAVKYSLKKAIFRLGPAGYVFEQYIARILQEDGYTTEVGVIVEGTCVSYEMDVVATKGNKRLFIECKYHNHAGIKSDLKVALYVQARYEDIIRARGRKDTFSNEGWIVTNTKCTSQAIAYAECIGLSIFAWRYPHDGGLEDMIESKHLYPITILPSLSLYALEKLSQEGMLLASDMKNIDVDKISKKLSLQKADLLQAQREALMICNGNA